MPGILRYDLDARVGKTIQRLREFRGISQQQLADLCGITQAAVSYFETGKRTVKLSVLDRIGTTLGISLSRVISLALGEEVWRESLLKETHDNVLDAQKRGTISIDDVEKKLGIS